MRPLIVLLLVIAAITALILALDPFGGDSSSSTAPVPETRKEVQPDTLEPNPALVGAPERDRVEPEAAAEGQDEGRVEAASTDTGNRLLGTVVDPDGNPVEAAKVTLTRIGRTTIAFADAAGRQNDVTTETDGDGRFLFVDVEPHDSYALIATHPDWSPKEVGSVQVGETGEFRERIQLEPGIRVYGVLTDTAGAPVPNATVRLSLTPLGGSTQNSPDTLATTSDGNGLYEFPNAAPGNCTLTVEAEGYGNVTIQSMSVSGREPIQRDIVLEVAHMLGGRVIAAGGDPIEDATVQAFSLDSRGSRTNSQSKTNEAGEFVFTDISEGTYHVTVNADGFKTHQERRVSTGELNLLVELYPYPTVSGRVLDEATGEPVQRFTVQLREEMANSDQMIPDPRTRKRVNDENGEYTLTVLKPGRAYLVEASSNRYPDSFSESFTVSDGQNLTDITVYMSPGGKLAGRVVDSSGDPIRGATVSTQHTDWSDDAFMRAMEDMLPETATERSTKSRRDGTFEVEALSPTTYLIDVKHGDFARHFQKEIAVSNGQTTDVGDVVLSRGGTVKGMVYDPSGNPLAGSVVQLNLDTPPHGSPVSYSTKTDADGHYTVNHVRPGTYNLRAIRTAEAGGNPFEHLQDMNATQTQIEVREGQEVTHVFKLTSKAQGDEKAGAGVKRQF